MKRNSKSSNADPSTGSGQDLRRRAEARLSERRQKSDSTPAKKADGLRLLHELEVHQIQMEMQNEELTQARANIEEVYRQFSDLYDFAPVGYFTLARDGMVRNVNLAGGNLLGVERDQLINRRLALFVSDEYRPAFNDFLEKLLSGKGKETCELAFLKNGTSLLWARLEATCFEGGQECRAVMMDVSERKRSEEEIKTILRTTIDGFYLVDMEGQILEANDSYCSMTGYSREELLKMSVKDVEAAETEEVIKERIQRILATGYDRFETRHKRKDGRVIDIEASVNLIDEQSKLFCFMRDITERKQAEEALRESQELFSLFMRHSPIYAFIKEVTPTGSRVLQASENYLDMIGIMGSQMVGKTMQELFPAEFAAKITADDWSVVSKGETLKLDEELNGRHYTSIKFPIVRGDKTLLAGYTIDITERKLAEMELQYMKEGLEAANIELHAALTRQQQLAHTDALTGINNRRRLYELVEHEFEIAARYQQPLSVIMFDIDHFKDVNDTFGHAAGDQMLQRVTQAACDELRSADVIGRYGGEEFVIVLPMTKAQQAHSLAERIRMKAAAIRVPTEKGDAAITLSIGIVEMIHGAQNGSAETLIRGADETMYAAKQAGRNRTEIGGQG